jgi:predicted nicotinamide N-methyase
MSSPRAFVLANTRPLPVPYVPELTLHLAGEPFELWGRTEAELGRAGLPPPFWAFPWAGGQALARYLLDRPDVACGRSVFDAASGSGLVAIAAARAGAAPVTACDIDRFAIAAIGLNAELNRVAVTARLGDPLDGDGDGAEVVLAGDVFYERSLADRVLPFLERAQARGATVLVGDLGRTYLPASRLEAVATYEVPVAPDLEDAGIKPTTVWRLTIARG